MTDHTLDVKRDADVFWFLCSCGKSGQARLDAEGAQADYDRHVRDETTSVTLLVTVPKADLRHVEKAARRGTVELRSGHRCYACGGHMDNGRSHEECRR